MDVQKDFDTLYGDLCQLGNTVETLAMWNQAVRMADARNDLYWGILYRMHLVEVAVFVGAHDQALMSFSWILTQYDRDPTWEEEFSTGHLMWMYKWIVEQIAGYPQISKQKMEQLVSDMEKRYRTYGYSLRAVEAIRIIHAIEMNQRDLAHLSYQKWMASQRDEMNDCPACEVHTEIMYDLYQEDDASALHKAQPLIENQIKSCSTTPVATYSLLLIPCLRLKQFDFADQLQQRGHSQVRKDPYYSGYVGEHLRYFALTRQWEKGLSLLSHTISHSLQAQLPYNRLQYFWGVRLFLLLYQQMGSTINLPLSIDERIVLPKEQVAYDCHWLSNYFYDQAQSLARQFDLRNGNDHYTKLTIENDQLAYKTW